MGLFSPGTLKCMAEWAYGAAGLGRSILLIASLLFYIYWEKETCNEKNITTTTTTTKICPPAGSRSAPSTWCVLLREPVEGQVSTEAEKWTCNEQKTVTQTHLSAILLSPDILHAWLIKQDTPAAHMQSWQAGWALACFTISWPIWMVHRLWVWDGADFPRLTKRTTHFLVF